MNFTHRMSADKFLKVQICKQKIQAYLSEISPTKSLQRISVNLSLFCSV